MFFILITGKPQTCMYIHGKRPNSGSFIWSSLSLSLNSIVMLKYVPRTNYRETPNMYVQQWETPKSGSFRKPLTVGVLLEVRGVSVSLSVGVPASPGCVM